MIRGLMIGLQPFHGRDILLVLRTFVVGPVGVGFMVGIREFVQSFDRRCRRVMAILLLASTGMAGCQSTEADHRLRWDGDRDSYIFDVGEVQTVRGLGAGQGVEVRDGFVYLYGDADTGVIREFRSRAHADYRQRLTPTGRSIRLTRGGRDVIGHPTGLTFHPAFGTVLGNTVNGVGTIYFLDWEQALADGHLDRSILHVVKDDAAVNGTRPEFVEFDGRWYVATSDYGASGNEIRLYDPTVLRRVNRTSEEGVLQHSWSCTPWVQNLYWHGSDKHLMLVQNQIEGLRWRLTVLAMTPDGPEEMQVVDLDDYDDELEGFHLLSRDDALFYTSSREGNVVAASVAR
ncbi:MAG: hypothetical protein ACPGXK_14185 [Phycisphaerae bacterium]